MKTPTFNKLTLLTFLAFLAWSLSSCRKNHAFFYNSSPAKVDRLDTKKSEIIPNKPLVSDLEPYSANDSIIPETEIIEMQKSPEFARSNAVKAEDSKAENYGTISDSLERTSASINKKGKPKPNAVKRTNKFLTPPLIVLSLVYPFLIAGLPILFLWIQQMKKNKLHPPEHFHKVGLLWGKVSLMISIPAMLFVAFALIGGLSVGLWPLFICSLAVSSGLIGLIYKPRKNKLAAWGSILGGIPILAGLVFILLLILTGFGP